LKLRNVRSSEIADVVVLGEGERSFSELLKRAAKEENIDDVAGCWTKRDGRIIKNEMGSLISNLDEVPFPHWRIFDDIHYYDSYIKKECFKWAKVVGTFESSRGCPYACTYCSNDFVRSLYKGKGTWRREKSPERIVQEIQLFRDDYGLDCVYWVDEILLTNIDRLKRFSDIYASKIGVPFVFMERPENMSDEKVRIIKRGGAQRVSIGIESGDENIRRNLLNRGHSQERIIAAFLTAMKHGLSTHAFTMIGFPNENIRSIKETYLLLKKAKPDTVQATIFYPLRGTKLFEYVVNEGLFDPDAPMPDTYYDASSLNFPESMKKNFSIYQNLLSNYNSRSTGLHFFILSLNSSFLYRVFLLFLRLYQKLRKAVSCKM